MSALYNIQLLQCQNGIIASGYLALVLDTILLELVFILSDELPDADIIPDDGTGQRLAGLAAPDDRGFTLVGDAYRGASALCM